VQIAREQINSHIVQKRTGFLSAIDRIEYVFLGNTGTRILTYFDVGLCNNYVNSFCIVYVYL